MGKDIGYEKGRKFIQDLRADKIKFEKRSNHGREFCGAYEKQHRENFQNYLGSCVRYIGNKRLKELKYYG